MDTKEWIKNNLFQNNKIISNRLKESFLSKNYPEQLQTVKEITSFLPSDSSIAERIYYIHNQKTSTQTCYNSNCNNQIKFLSFNYGLQKYCCRQCSSSNEEKKDAIRKIQKKHWSNRSQEDIKKSSKKRKTTCMKKYGTENPAQSEKIKNKISSTLKESYESGQITSSFKDLNVQKKCKETQIKKYGDIFTASDIGKEKIKQSNIKKYGVENVFSNTSIKEKIIEKHLEKRGVSNPQKDKNVQEKTKRTCLKRYGVEYSLGSNEVREKSKETLIKKYGVSHPMHSEKIKNKMQKTCNNKYGVNFASQKDIPKEVLEKLSNEEWLKKQHYDLKKPTSFISKELGVSETLVSKRMHKLGLEVKRYGFSQPEIEIINFIAETGVENISLQSWNIINRKEIDIYLPNHALAIEYNGLFWHSEEYGKGRSYHLHKTQECLKQNIQLLHIFENEWMNEYKKDIWKSIIVSNLKKSNRIYARKTQVKEIKDNALVKDFLLKNHLQGNIHANTKLGLFFENELVSVMTFSKPRYSNYEWEIIRFCNKKFITIIGGASKLFKHFLSIKNPKNIISYSDKRIGEGKVYTNLNFKFNHLSKPNYFYFKPGSLDLHSRIKFQKHKLPELLDDFDPDLSESNNMSNNGYYRIWDCGNNVYTWIK